jgi:16S rRNA (guanine1207-N2)-methyltransferase
VFLLDKDPVAMQFASANARLNEVGGVTVVCSDGLRDFRETRFTKILCNPPYHADFEVPKHFIHKGFNRLELGGTLYMVTKREAWYRRKLQAIFGVVRVHTIGSYFVFEATKTAATYANARRG